MGQNPDNPYPPEKTSLDCVSLTIKITIFIDTSSLIIALSFLKITFIFIIITLKITTFFTWLFFNFRWITLIIHIVEVILRFIILLTRTIFILIIFIILTNINTLVFFFFIALTLFFVELFLFSKNFLFEQSIALLHKLISLCCQIRLL